MSSISSSTAKLSSRFRELLPERIDIGDFVNSALEGDSGNIEVKANSVKIEHSGQINVSNFGTGDGGEIALNANSIELDDGGGITASTSSGEGGNITLNTDNLSLLNQAQITASAGGAGNGGNININSDTILGLNNSDITANAVAGNGGNINIESEAVIGLEGRSQLTPFNDITASSELGIDGTVTISSPENNSNEDLIISAKEVGIYQDQELFSDGCNNRNGKGMKIAYLNSGSPESPDDFFDDEEPLPLSEDSDSITSSASELDLENAVPPLWSQGDPVVEGNMIQTNSDGSVYFVAVDKEKTVESMVCTQDAESFF